MIDGRSEKRILELERRVHKLEADAAEMETQLIRFIGIFKALLDNPRVKATLGGTWTVDPKIIALMEGKKSDADTEPGQEEPG